MLWRYCLAFNQYFTLRNALYFEDYNVLEIWTNYSYILYICTFGLRFNIQLMWVSREMALSVVPFLLNQDRFGRNMEEQSFCLLNLNSGKYWKALERFPATGWWLELLAMWAMYCRGSGVPCFHSLHHYQRLSKRGGLVCSWCWPCRRMQNVQCEYFCFNRCNLPKKAAWTVDFSSVPTYQRWMPGATKPSCALYAGVFFLQALDRAAQEPLAAKLVPFHM